MKSWRVHLAWAMVTLVAIAVTARLAATRPEFRVRPTLQTAPAAAAPAGEVPVSVRSVEPTVALLPEPAAPTSPSPDQIRALLREKSTWTKGWDAIKVLQDRALKLALLEECLTLAAVDQRIPVSALMLLGEMGGPEAAEIVEKYYREARDDRSRLRATRTLGKIRETRSIPLLLEAYHSDSVDLKVAGAAALHAVGQDGPATELLGRLVRGLDDPDGALRRETLENISTLGIPASLPILTRCLNDSNGDVRSEAISGLEMLALPEVFPLLERAAQDPNRSVAEEARQALERLRKPKEKKSP